MNLENGSFGFCPITRQKLKPRSSTSVEAVANGQFVHLQSSTQLNKTRILHHKLTPRNSYGCDNGAPSSTDEAENPAEQHQMHVK